MLDIKYIRQHADEVKENAKRRGVAVDVDVLLGLDDNRRALLTQIEELRAARNQKSKTKPTEEEIGRMRRVGDDIVRLETDLEGVEKNYNVLLLQIPNLTHPDVPAGGEDDFNVLATAGEAPRFDFTPKDHEELLQSLDLLDFERGAKVAGAKFYFAKGALVLLNQALINYGMDVVTAHGYQLMETPDLAKDEILQGIGFAPRGPETQVYSIENSDLSLIGTAEITIGGYHAGEILDLSDGPKKYVALSHCFRTEAGSHGRESKGLYRVHQFTKLEMFVFCRPQESEQLHQELLAIEREIVDGLKLPYRVIDIASGDLGGPAYRKYDIEAWMVMRASGGERSTEASRPNVRASGGERSTEASRPNVRASGGERSTEASRPNVTGGYGEITSTSNCTDYQARRLGIRYRLVDGSTALVHTLNGTAIVLSRMPIAIAENCQTDSGTIKVPKVLQKYMGGLKEIK